MGRSANSIPSGVADFDSIIKGGFPAGSVVLLIGGVGAGQAEFALTSAAKLSMVMENPSSKAFLLGPAKDSTMPEQICYITFSRSRDEVLQELEFSFNKEFHDAFERVVKFKDFSEAYFRKTLVPRSWTGGGPDSLFSSSSSKNVLESLVDYLDENAPRSMVVIDSLTDLVVSANIDMTDLVAVLRGLQRVSKKWGRHHLSRADRGCSGQEDAEHDNGLRGWRSCVRMEPPPQHLAAPALHVRGEVHLTSATP